MDDQSALQKGRNIIIKQIKIMRGFKGRIVILLSKHTESMGIVCRVIVKGLTYVSLFIHSNCFRDRGYLGIL